MKTIRVPSAEKMAEIAAELAIDCATRTVEEFGSFTLALAGGRTPLPLYQLLAQDPRRERFPSDRTHFFWTDERCIPPDDPESNHRAAREVLLAPLCIPETRIHRIPAELGPQKGARLYEEELRRLFPDAGLPVFDLVLLGMGADGHTASLFLGDEALRERERWVYDVPPGWGSPPVARVTLTLPVLNAARHVLIMTAVKGKERVLEAVLDGSSEGARLPIALVRPTDGTLTWVLEE